MDTPGCSSEATYIGVPIYSAVCSSTTISNLYSIHFNTGRQRGDRRSVTVVMQQQLQIADSHVGVAPQHERLTASFAKEQSNPKIQLLPILRYSLPDGSLPVVL